MKIKKYLEPINELTMPAITKMNISLQQMGTFKKSISGHGQTPDKALKDLMTNVYKYYSSFLKKGKSKTFAR